jgi:hypothetical protein
LQESHLLLDEKADKDREMDEMKNIVGEKESHLKVAQQHLAKKVKEFAILDQKYNEQQIEMQKCVEIIQDQKIEMAQLRESMDFFQSQEQHLQEELRQLLKGNENQAMKWEEKYFHMYDKWQESENQIRELKKFEEKHLQMQSLLSNLGNFMGGSIPSHGLFISEERKSVPSSHSEGMTVTLGEEKEELRIHENESDNKYDLFGLRPVRQSKDMQLDK